MQAFMGAGFAANGGGGGNFNFEIPDRKAVDSALATK
jgi:hypothetical protein